MPTSESQEDLVIKCVKHVFEQDQDWAIDLAVRRNTTPFRSIVAVKILSRSIKDAVQK